MQITRLDFGINACAQHAHMHPRHSLAPDQIQSGIRHPTPEELSGEECSQGRRDIVHWVESLDFETLEIEGYIWNTTPVLWSLLKPFTANLSMLLCCLRYGGQIEVAGIQLAYEASVPICIQVSHWNISQSSRCDPTLGARNSDRCIMVMVRQPW